MRAIILSDTHQLHRDIVVPDGDVLIHCGDFSHNGKRREVESFRDWLSSLPHKHKLYIAGNHDVSFQEDPDAALRWMDGVGIYLLDSGVAIDGVSFWGSPWLPAFGGWAFELSTESDLARKWDKIPPDTEVLITHSPPKEILDFVPGVDSWFGGKRIPEPQGSNSLRHWVDKNRPAVHAFGHIHESYGVKEAEYGTIFVNASTLDGAYRPTRKPVVIDRRGPRDWMVVDYGPRTA